MKFFASVVSLSSIRDNNFTSLSLPRGSTIREILNLNSQIFSLPCISNSPCSRNSSNSPFCILRSHRVLSVERRFTIRSRRCERWTFGREVKKVRREQDRGRTTFFVERCRIYFRFFFPFSLLVYSTRNVSHSRMQNWQISNLSTPSLSMNEISNSSTFSYCRVAVQIRLVVNIEK